MTHFKSIISRLYLYFPCECAGCEVSLVLHWHRPDFNSRDIKSQPILRHSSLRLSEFLSVLPRCMKNLWPPFRSLITCYSVSFDIVYYFWFEVWSSERARIRKAWIFQRSTQENIWALRFEPMNPKGCCYLTPTQYLSPSCFVAQNRSLTEHFMTTGS